MGVVVFFTASRAISAITIGLERRRLLDEIWMYPGRFAVDRPFTMP